MNNTGQDVNCTTGSYLWVWRAPLLYINDESVNDCWIIVDCYAIYPLHLNNLQLEADLVYIFQINTEIKQKSTLVVY